MKLITRDELRTKLERGDDFKLVMTLSTFAYAAKHIPTSLQFETVDETLAALDPGEEIVVYCADVYCAASIYAYMLLERAGYTRLRRCAGGIADWEDGGYPVEDGLREGTGDRPLEEPQRPRRSTPASRTRRPWRLCA
jgi:rhodanese-related sulfurtransferase